MSLTSTTCTSPDAWDPLLGPSSPMNAYLALPDAGSCSHQMLWTSPLAVSTRPSSTGAATVPPFPPPPMSQMATPSFQSARKRRPSRRKVSCTYGRPSTRVNTSRGAVGVLRSTITIRAGEPAAGSIQRNPYSVPPTRPTSAVCTPGDVLAVEYLVRSAGFRGWGRLYSTIEPGERSVATIRSAPSSDTATSPRVDAPSTVTE